MPGRRTIYRLAEIKVFRSEYLHVSTLTPLFTCHIESPPSRLIFLDTNDIWRQECLERTSPIIISSSDNSPRHSVSSRLLFFSTLRPTALAHSESDQQSRGPFASRDDVMCSSLGENLLLIG